MSTTKLKHSALPWKVAADGEGILSEFVAEPRQAIRRIADTHIGYATEYYPKEEREANAQLIVRAVNSHTDMLEALEHLTMLLRDIRNLYPGNPAGEWLTKSKCYTAALQAIAKARGKE